MELTTRATFRGQVTKIAKNASEYLQLKESRVKQDNVEMFDEIEENLTAWIQRLSAAHASLGVANDEVRKRNLLKMEEIDKELQKIAEYEDLAVGVLAKLNARLKNVQHKQGPYANIPQTAAINTPERKSSSSTKLQKLQLRNFSGDINEWIPFWQQFRTVVHEDSSLTGIDKFNYLEMSLTGQAKRTIAGFIPSAECYDAAISMLLEEYNDHDRLVDKIMQQLLALKSVQSKADVFALHNLYNAVMACIRSLTALGVPTSHYYVMLKTVLLKCLPNELRIEYYRTYDAKSSNECDKSGERRETGDAEAVSSASSLVTFEGGASIKNILKFLKGEIDALERAGADKRTSTNNYKATSFQSTAAGLMISNTNNNNMCLFCKATSHNSRECDQKASLDKMKDLLKGEAQCFKCFRRGHTARYCRAKWIRCGKCNGNHPSVFCDPAYKLKPKGIVKAENRAGEGEMASSSQLVIAESNVDVQPALNLCAYNNSEKLRSAVYLQTASVFVSDSQKTNSAFARIIIDGGSQHTYIKEHIAKKLNLEVVGIEIMSVVPFGQNELPPSKKFNRVKVNLNSQHDHQYVEIEAVVVPNICLDVLVSPNNDTPKMKGLTLADISIDKVEREDGLSLLIGADYYWEVVTGRQKRITRRLRAVQTIFGWTLQGPADASDGRLEAEQVGIVSKVSHNLFCASNMEQSLTNMWSLEILGIKNDVQESAEEAIRIARKCIIKRQDRYEVQLPWRANVRLYNNKEAALSRLRSLLRGLSRVPGRLEEYDVAMKEFISAGFAEPVCQEKDGGRIFYLPHRPIYKEESSTTRLRIVFDASAHTESMPSLNDQLHTGSNLLPDILKILLNFRLEKVGMVADIEKAFLQIALAESDRDSHRFIWISDVHKAVKGAPNYQIYRMTRLTFGVTSSPFLLSATLRTHLESESSKYPDTCRLLLESFYMDDLVLSTTDVSSGTKLYHESLSIMDRAAMNLRKWNSNCEVIRRLFATNSTVVAQKVLGLLWCVISDELSVNIQAVENFINEQGGREGTKRNVLQVIARIFDPLGMLGPVVIRLKILFQKIWRLKLDWDEPLEKSCMIEWKHILRDFLELKNFAIPRCISESDIIQREVHIFADASPDAYGAVAYVKSKDPGGKINISFLCAKCRVAPLKMCESNGLTVPKLELTAALIAARLCNYLKRSLKVDLGHYHMWSDSEITLQWIKGDTKKWKPYVTRRVEEIRQHTEVDWWRHCSGKDNPADLLTRGISARNLVTSSLWASGPHWLKEFEGDSKDGNSLQNVPVILTSLLVETNVVPSEISESILDASQFSCWKRLLRVTAYVLRFVKLVLKKLRPQSKYLTAEEIGKAEGYWINYAQVKEFPDELKALRNGKPLPKTSRILSLDPFLDEEGVMRVRGRLQSLNESVNVMHPIILSKSSLISELIVHDAHQRTLHSGTGIVLTRLRESFGF